MWFLSPKPKPGRAFEFGAGGTTGGGTTPPPPLPGVPPVPPEFELELEATFTPGAVPELFVSPLLPGESPPEPGDGG